MSQFKLPPVSTLMGSNIKNYFKILKQGSIDSKYYFKVSLTTLIVIVSSPFHLWEKLVFAKKLSKYKLEKPPLFIIGHWRSGTTLLHNMLCSDPNTGYLTTYQSVFPNNLASKAIFKTFMKIFIPEKRPSDNVKLNVDFPQEDEFAFSNSNHNSYYNFFYFPNNYKSFYEKAIHHTGLTEREKARWFKSYDNLLKKASINTKGNRLVVKNPVNTARIKQLLKLYPDAKFLYIYRNPITVFISTRHFFKKLFPTLILHEIDDETIETMIFDVYKWLMDDYLTQKNMIPKKNLIELRYEDFEKDPVEESKNIYNNLLNEDFDSVKSHFSSYFSSIKGYKKNRYEIEQSTIEKIKTHLGKFMDIYNYDIPNDIIIKN